VWERLARWSLDIMSVGSDEESVNTSDQEAPCSGVPLGVAEFLLAIFDPKDVVTLRPIETWVDEKGRKRGEVLYDLVKHCRAETFAKEGPAWAVLLDQCAAKNANTFFGVCPRAGYAGYDLAWQIRTVRVLWADLDYCTPDEAKERCRNAGLPEPSVIVSSGNGVHLYWILDAPFLIDDAGASHPK
jgi:hypothetical protein